MRTCVEGVAQALHTVTMNPAMSDDALQPPGHQVMPSMPEDAHLSPVVLSACQELPEALVFWGDLLPEH